MGLLASLAAALVAAVSPVSFLQAHASDGAFAEAGGRADPALTAWAVLGLRAAGADAPGSLDYLRAREGELRSATDVALVALAEQALGDPATRARRAPRARAPTVASGRRSTRPTGASSRRGARAPPRRGSSSGTRRARAGSRGEPASPRTRTTPRPRSRRSPSRACAGSRSTARSRSCSRSRTRDGGFELTRGRGADAQSTAWAIQGLVAAGRKPPRSAFAYLARLRRADGSYRYSARYAATPVWVTAQVLAGLAKRPFPLTARPAAG